MLTIPETVAAHADAAVHKVALLRTPGLLLVRTMLAGAAIGIGVLVMVTAGGPLVAAGSPWAPLVNGLVFGIALTIVLVAGGELATSAMMILTQGALLGRVGWGRALVALLAALAGNLLGAMLFAALVHTSGVAGPGTAAGEALARMVAHKAEATTSELVVRGILCNVLVCLAVWCWGRIGAGTAGVAVVVGCVMVFITSGFEHVVANMTTFSLALYGDLPHATLAEAGRNLLAVGVGNTVGGALLVGAAYAYGVRPAVAPATRLAPPAPVPAGVLLSLPVPAEVPDEGALR
ncbi:formate/nitrite transporter family protein [Cellulomonas shaoxiangyii]|uniref:Formate/nitrite transporter n=1 Tax=Cellulomonas shaoxiangyii TaxID=2566013 RepID=A0A4P7SFV9_9CELL|nr:formate/nitrite transporter family protein [Cellulomonas shaoxiangyii]QCB92790.1 formate/nitrite transporter [Cellulomonas shaoxiangyii]TGY78398.1 formate/nitrite transporter [Cellulomonas shaoxiangyii]